MTDFYEGDEKSKKPSDKVFYQQELWAWEPVMTPIHMTIIFLVAGLICLPIGIALVVANNGVQEYRIRYDRDCDHLNGPRCEDYLKNNVGSICICNDSISFDVLRDTKNERFYIYYEIGHFYQNHRQYARSMDYPQIMGKPRTVEELEYKCRKLRSLNETSDIPIAPCGFIANSKFNDTISMRYKEPDSDTETEITLVRKGIAWRTDKILFKNPTDCDQDNLETCFKNTVKPPHWSKPVYELETGDPSNNGYQNEDLIVWMRPSTFNNVRKLYGWIDPTWNDGLLPAGTYSFDIGYAFPVSAFDGTKHIVISTMSWAGGKNSFLGTTYVVTSFICLMLAGGSAVFHLKLKTREDIRTTIKFLDMFASPGPVQDRPINKGVSYIEVDDSAQPQGVGVYYSPGRGQENELAGTGAVIITANGKMDTTRS